MWLFESICTLFRVAFGRMQKLAGNVLAASMLLILCLTAFGQAKSQVLEPGKQIVWVWEDACPVDFLYQNTEDATDQHRLKMVFLHSTAADFYWECAEENFVPFDNFRYHLGMKGSIQSSLGHHVDLALVGEEQEAPFQAARMMGEWYKVKIDGVDVVEGNAVVQHHFKMGEGENGKEFRIAYVPDIGIVEITNAQGNYVLVQVNGQPFDLEGAKSLVEMRAEACGEGNE